MKVTLSYMLAVVGTASLMVGCNKSKSGFDAASPSVAAPSDGSSGDNNSQGTPGSGSTPSTQAPNLNANVDEGLYKGTQTVSFDQNTGEVVLSMPMGIGLPIGIGSGSVSQLPGVSFYTTTDSKGQYYLVFRIPVKYLVRGVNTVKSSTLPNGDSLAQYLPAGEASAFALSYTASQKVNIYLYIASEAVAVYVEADWITCGDLPICIGFNWPIKNKAANKEVGRLAILMPRAGVSTKGGLLMSMRLPDGAARLLENYIK